MRSVEYFSQFKESTLHTFKIFSGRANKSIEIPGDKGPVIVIHGVFGGWLEGSIKDYLIDNNIEASLPYLGAYTRGIDHYAKQMGELINRFPNSTILGFSSGGLSALRLAERLGWESISKIITIGTPFNGVPFGFLSFAGKTFEDIRPGSRLLREVMEITPPHGKVTSVFAKNDQFTPDPEKLTLNWPSVVVDGPVNHGHLQNSVKHISHILDAELGITK